MSLRRHKNALKKLEEKLNLQAEKSKMVSVVQFDPITKEIDIPDDAIPAAKGVLLVPKPLTLAQWQYLYSSDDIIELD